MQDGRIYLDEQLIDGLRKTIDDRVVASLLAEFIAMLEAVRSELDSIPSDAVDAVRFLAVKPRFGSLLPVIDPFMEANRAGPAK